MKNLVIIISFGASMVIAVSCNSGQPKTNNRIGTQGENSKEYYTCTMHPEVHMDKPGNCPKCGMELIKVEMTGSDSTHMQHTSDSIR